MSQTLSLFAYGVMSDYAKAPQNYITLKQPQLHKLRLLSIVDLALKNQTVDYKQLMNETQIKD